MKQSLWVCIGLLFASGIHAQDIITKRNGDDIEAKVLEVSDTEIKYKKWSNQDGPTYTSKVADIFMIKYQNGDKDVFKEVPQEKAEAAAAQGQPVQPVGEIAKPAANNAELIASYRDFDFNVDIERSNVPAKYYIGVYGFTEGSVASSDELEVQLVYTSEHPYGNAFIDHGYYLVLTNKLGQYIYIDRAGSVAGNDSYYNPKQATTTTGNSKSGSAGVNMGGVASALGVGGVIGGLAGAVNVGGGTSSTNVTTESFGQDRFLVLAPMGKANMKRTSIWTDKKGAHQKDLKELTNNCDYDEYITTKSAAIEISRGEVKTFDNDSPRTKKFVITYSTDPTFATYKTMVFEVGLVKVIGCKSNEFNKIRRSLKPGTIHN